VVVDDDYLRAPVPAPELRVDPGVVLAADLPLVEIWLGRVQRHDLGLAVVEWHRRSPLAQAKELLEVPVADVPGVVVARHHDDVRALQAVQVAPRLLELPPVALHREVPGNGHEVRLERVGLLYGGLQKLELEEPGSHVDVRHLNYFHLRLPYGPTRIIPSPRTDDA
jgi:hypothetical protein